MHSSKLSEPVQNYKYIYTSISALGVKAETESIHIKSTAPDLQSRSAAEQPRVITDSTIIHQDIDRIYKDITIIQVRKYSTVDTYSPKPSPHYQAGRQIDYPHLHPQSWNTLDQKHAQHQSVLHFHLFSVHK